MNRLADYLAVAIIPKAIYGLDDDHYAELATKILLKFGNRRLKAVDESIYIPFETLVRNGAQVNPGGRRRLFRDIRCYYNTISGHEPINWCEYPYVFGLDPYTLIEQHTIGGDHTYPSRVTCSSHQRSALGLNE